MKGRPSCVYPSLGTGSLGVKEGVVSARISRSAAVNASMSCTERRSVLAYLYAHVAPCVVAWGLTPFFLTAWQGSVLARGLGRTPGASRLVEQRPKSNVCQCSLLLSDRGSGAPALQIIEVVRSYVRARIPLGYPHSPDTRPWILKSEKLDAQAHLYPARFHRSPM